MTEDGARSTCEPAARVHGTCVDIGGAGVILSGPSGSGKSDLALRLIDAGARLVADDQIELRIVRDRLVASPPASIAGLLEVRGIGIVRVEHATDVWVRLLVELVQPALIERMPEPGQHRRLAGISVPTVALAAFEASAVAKVRLAVRDATRDIMPPS